MKIPNLRFTHIISPGWDLGTGVVAGLAGYFLYDIKTNKLDRPDDTTLYQMLEPKIRAKLAFLSIRKEGDNAKNEDVQLEKDLAGWLETQDKPNNPKNF